MAEPSVIITSRRNPPSTWSPLERWYADLRENSDWKNHHFGRRAHRHDHQREVENPGQRRNPSRATAFDLCWKTVGRWPNPQRLQYPEGIHPPLGPPLERWHADLRENSDWKNHHFGRRAHRHDHQREIENPG